MVQVQVVRRTKPRPITFYRAAPYTIWHPTEAQIKMRRLMAQVAKKYKGLKGFDPKTGLPIIAAKVREELKGVRVTKRRKRKKLDERIEAETFLRLISLKYKVARAVALAKLREVGLRP
ncbi:hypothetical protein DRH14_05470 [Candidatus Shapirobacteria bacterium]|nr:MAG: hypothetical protein DRH14_05470 [Candidatus Shapirobacteria bacterium]